MSNIINVQFQDKETGEYSGRGYSFFAGIELAVGDFAIAPTKYGERVVKVSAINVPESKVDERILPDLKTITQKYEPEAKPADAPADRQDSPMPTSIEDL